MKGIVLVILLIQLNIKFIELEGINVTKTSKEDNL
jgi:hypothetical protein